jgi:hypothetical protein
MARIKGSFLVVWALLSLMSSSQERAQTGSASLTGTITDPSGASVAEATVSLVLARGGQPTTVRSDQQGMYQFRRVAPGSYTLTATAKGFAVHKTDNVSITVGTAQKLDIRLSIEEEKEQVDVQDEAARINVSPTSNASAVIISGKDMEALADDPDELESQLAALAGPSAGPDGGQFYVDGFTVEQQLPTKNSIREIRVNQNPFSAQYDKLGYGRVEVFTKPGTNEVHGQFMADGNDLAFDTRDPFSVQEPGYNSLLLTSDVGGPINKKASFFLDFQHRNVNVNEITNAVVLDSNLNQVPSRQTFSNPSSRTVITPRIDYQVMTNNTLTVRYEYWQQNQTGAGIGQFALSTQAYDTRNTQHILELGDTQVIGSRIVNETHFQYIHEGYTQTPVSGQPEILVLGAFTAGGSGEGQVAYHHNHYEFRNDTSIALSDHFVKFGGRLRALAEPYSSTADFNGTYTFKSLNAYRVTLQGLASELTPAEIAAAGGGPSQFTLVAGTPLVNISAIDAGIYAEDNWRVRTNVSLSYGLRFETQNYIHDQADWAPRVGIAWGIRRGKSGAPRTILRAGFGLFYDRFANNLILQAEQLNGSDQTEYIIKSPTFYPTVPAPSSLLAQGATTTVYRIDPKLHAPYTIQSAASVERQLTTAATLSVTYLNSRGVHQLLTNNINAPLPGTYNPAVPSSGVRPNPSLGNIYDYESVGIFKQNEIIANINVRAGAKLSLFGFYSLNYADSDTGGPSSFPDNPYNISQDYGRAAFAIRHRLLMGGSVGLPHGFRLSPLVILQSGAPFNIIGIGDLNGSTVFNQRPAFATTSTSIQDEINTPYGLLNIAPSAGEPLIPINYGTGPRQFSTNLRVSKTISFGGGAKEHAAGEPNYGPGSQSASPGQGLEGRGLSNTSASNSTASSARRRFSLTFSISGRNIFNTVNLTPPEGHLGSPLFDRSTALAGGSFSFNGVNRRIDMQCIFNF